MQAYCLKCKAEKEMQNEEQVALKNDRKAIKGMCPDCGTAIFKILGKK